MNYLCPVCGWPNLHEPPRSVDGGASFELCPSCGFEFGFDDDDQGLIYEAARTRWVAAGMPWWSSSRQPPADWNPGRQLTDAGLA
jgi:hypothetical protein